MTRLSFFFILIPLLSVILLSVTFILAPHEPYKEKETPFECGYHSFLQTRNQFAISFFVFGLLFLLFDLEIVLIYPYSTSSLFNGLYGLISIVIFILVLTLGFVFEIGKKALKIDAKDSEKLFSKIFPTSLLGIKSYFITFVFISSVLYLYNYLFSINLTFFIGIIATIIIVLLNKGFLNKPLTTNDIYLPIIIFSFFYVVKLTIIGSYSSSLYSNFMHHELDDNDCYVDMLLESYIQHSEGGEGLYVTVLPVLAYACAEGSDYISSIHKNNPDLKPNIDILLAESDSTSGKRKRSISEEDTEIAPPSKKRRSLSPKEEFSIEGSSTKRKRSLSPTEEITTKKFKFSGEDESVSSTNSDLNVSNTQVSNTQVASTSEENKVLGTIELPRDTTANTNNSISRPSVVRSSSAPSVTSQLTPINPEVTTRPSDPSVSKQLNKSLDDLDIKYAKISLDKVNNSDSNISSPESLNSNRSFNATEEIHISEISGGLTYMLKSARMVTSDSGILLDVLIDKAQTMDNLRLPEGMTLDHLKTLYDAGNDTFQGIEEAIEDWNDHLIIHNQISIPSVKKALDEALYIYQMFNSSIEILKNAIPLDELEEEDIYHLIRQSDRVIRRLDSSIRELNNKVS